jgi:predicted nucleic acid-binding protein
VTTYYFDSSALIKRYITEAGSARVRMIADPGAGNLILIAQITPVELYSALARRMRDKTISTHTARGGRLLIERHVRREYTVVWISDAIVQRAGDLLYAYPLRAYDAVQLASAIEANTHLAAADLPPLTFVCADRRLLDVADMQGLPVEGPE